MTEEGFDIKRRGFSKKSIEELKSELLIENSQFNRIIINYVLGIKFVNKADVKNSNFFFDEALQISEKADWRYGKAIAIVGKGFCSSVNNNLPKASQFILNGLKYLDKKEYPSFYCFANIQLSKIYNGMGLFEKSIKTLKNIDLIINDVNYRIEYYTILAVNFESCDKNKEADRLLIIAKNFAEKNASDLISYNFVSYDNYIECLIRRKEIDKAYYEIEKLEKVLLTLEDPYTLHYCCKKIQINKIWIELLQEKQIKENISKLLNVHKDNFEIIGFQIYQYQIMIAYLEIFSEYIPKNSKLLKNDFFENIEKNIIITDVQRSEYLKYVIKYYARIEDYKKAYKKQQELNKLKQKMHIEKQKNLVTVMEIEHDIEQKEQAYRHQQEVLAAKTRFFADITHEIKTPLTLIQAPAESILISESLEQSKSQAATILKNSHTITSLVNQMLDLHKAEMGNLKIYLTQGNILEQLKNYAFDFKERAKSKNLQFSFVSNVEALHTNFDQDKLQKIVLNLLSNAFKFTKKGKVELEVAVPKESKSGITIKITDTGIGINKKNQAKVFERYFQVEGANDESIQGTGIGLALVKELINLMHGEITISSTINKGSTFSVFLPLKHISVISYGDNKKLTEYITEPTKHKGGQKEPILLPRSYGKETTDKGKETLLIVEDNEDIRSYLQAYFEGFYKVEIAKDGKEGEEKAKKLLPDVIVSDVKMPKKNGYELCASIKKEVTTNHIPIILLTAKNEQEDKLKGLELGADAYMSKPFNMAELKLRVEKLIEQRSLLKRKYRKLIDSGIEEHEIQSLEEVFLEEVMQAIYKNYSEESFGVSELAKEIGMERTGLFKKLKAVLDKSPSQLISEIRLQEAKKYLLRKNESIASIAYKVGFSSTTYFSSSFKKYYGISAGQLLK